MKKLATRLALVVSFGFVVPLSLRADAEPQLRDYLGRWAILITDSRTSFRSCFLRLEETDGTAHGELVWKWGSVWEFRGKDIVSVEKGKLLIKKPDFETPLTLELVGDALEGFVHEKEGGRRSVYAVRDDDSVDPEGVWDVSLVLPEGERSGRLVLRDEGCGRVAARAFSDDGNEVRVTSATLQGNDLAVAFEADDGARIALKAELRGDRMTGALRTPDDEILFKGVRRRTWGPPVQLLASGLDGWRPRDRSREFRWICEDGVLANGNHDVDIVSKLEFEDFKLNLEYNISEGGNSGVYLRGRYEVQILDDAGRGVRPHGNGAVYSRLAPQKNASQAHDTWQKYEITLIGRYLTVVLNGETLIDNQRLAGITGGALDPFEWQAGPLMLQGDHGKVRFRNIAVRPALAPAVEITAR